MDVESETSINGENGGINERNSEEEAEGKAFERYSDEEAEYDQIKQNKITMEDESETAVNDENGEINELNSDEEAEGKTYERYSDEEAEYDLIKRKKFYPQCIIASESDSNSGSECSEDDAQESQNLDLAKSWMSPEICPEMGADVTDMIQNLLQRRPPGILTLQCSECDLVCPSLPALEFHTKLHVMEKIIQSSKKHPGIGIKKSPVKVNGDKSYEIKNRSPKNKILNQQKSPKEDNFTHVKEARDIATIMQILASQGASEKNSHCGSGSIGKPYKCNECDMRFTTSSHLTRHMLTHTGEKPYACSECEFRSARKDKLKKHMQSFKPGEKHIVKHSGKGNRIKRVKHAHSWTCFIINCPEAECAYKCTSTSMLKLHMVNHTDKRPFKCKECENRFNAKESLQEHMLIHKTSKSFSCTHCKYSCSSQSQFNRHMFTHTGTKPHACSICDYKCIERGNLTKHMLIHGDEKPFSCPEEGCDYKCKLKCNLKSHMVKHTGEKPFACHLCDFSSNLKASLTTHLFKHSGEKPFSCPEEGCDYKCTLKCNLKSHMLKHSGEKPHMCHLCDYRSFLKSNLTTHMLKHSGEKPFTCPVCGNGYAVKGDLKVHMRIHTNDKKFKCQLCDYRCFTQQRVNQHMLTHTGEKPHKCDECGSRFTSTSNLKKHMRTHGIFGSTTAGPSLHKCDECGSRFKTSLNLKKHMKTHGIYGPISAGTSQLSNDSQHHSQVSSAISQAHPTFHPGNTHPLNNQHIIEINSIMGRSSHETTNPDANYKVFPSNMDYHSLSKMYNNFPPSAKPLWHQGSSGIPTDGYNCQALSDKLLY